MEILDQVGLPALEFGVQQLSEQVVIAVPLTAAVERDHQQIPAFHPLQDAAGFLRARTASQSGPHILSSTEVRVRNDASASRPGRGVRSEGSHP